MSPGLLLFLLFVGVPLAETFLLVLAGSHWGPAVTFGLVVLTGLIGSILARRAGFGVLRQLQDDLARGLPPRAHLAEAALVLTGGLLLLTPGFLTDGVGLSLLWPPTRKGLWVPALVRALEGRIVGATVQVHTFSHGPTPPRSRPEPLRQGPDRSDPSSSPFDHPVQ